MTTHTISLNCPRMIGKVPWGLLSLNAERKLHWSARKAVAAYWRSNTESAVRMAGIPPMGRVHVVVYFHKATNRMYDVSNLLPVAKSCVDGMVDAGIIEDDNNHFLIGPDMRAGTKSSTPHVVIEIIDLVGAE